MFSEVFGNFKICFGNIWKMFWNILTCAILRMFRNFYFVPKTFLEVFENFKICSRNIWKVFRNILTCAVLRMFRNFYFAPKHFTNLFREHFTNVLAKFSRFVSKHFVYSKILRFISWNISKVFWNIKDVFRSVLEL